ncbi:MAG: Fic family protein, partial [Parcubacteria group bacterium]
KLYLRKQSTYSENEVYPYLKIEDFDSALIQKARQMAVNNQANHPWQKLSDFELLQSSGLYLKDYRTGDKGFTLATVLLFGKDDVILSVLPHHKTDAILRKKNLDRYDDRDDIRTNLLDSFDRIMQFSQKHLPDPFYTENNQRVSVRDKIVRELASNILIHREYKNAFPAKYIIESDRIFVENSNKPHGFGNIDIQNFTPYPKNPTIARIFKEVGLADELGSGTRNLVKFGKLYSDTPVELVENDIFKTTIYISEQATPQAEQVEKVLEFCKTPKSRKEIQEHIGLEDREHFRKEILNPLIEEGKLKLTIPEKRTSPNQKYISK